MKVPVFLWHGECDKQMPIEPARELARLLPACELHFVPGAGHLLLESEEMRQSIMSGLLSVDA